MTSAARTVSSMAAVRAELRLRDGSSQKMQVQVEDNLQSLLRGILQINLSLKQLLSELVEGDRPGGQCAPGEDEEESDEDPEPQPPVKRSKS